MDDELKTEFSWSDLLEIWIMAYERGYEHGYRDKAIGCEYNSGTYAQPPDVLLKIFESSKGNKE